MIQYFSQIGNKVSETSREELILDWITYPNDEGWFELPERLIEPLPYVDYQFTSCVYRIKDKTFITLNGATEPIEEKGKFYFIVYDHFTKRFSNIKSTQNSFLANDPHNKAIVYQDPKYPDRLIMKRTMRGPGGEGPPTTTQRSGPNYNLLELGAEVPFSPNFTYYQKPLMGTDGSLYSIERPVGLSLINLYKMNSDTLVWDDMGEVASVRYADGTPADDIRFYIRNVYTTEPDTYKFFWNRIENYRRSQRYVFYAESRDMGYTWTNIQGTYSHNIVTDGKLTLQVFIDYFLVLDNVLNTGTIKQTYATEIDGEIYSVGSVNNDNDTGIIHWNPNTKNWETHIIKCPTHTIGKTDVAGDDYATNQKNMIQTYLYKKNGLFYIYVSYINESGNYVMAHFSSSDLDNWTWIEDLGRGQALRNSNSIMVNSGEKPGTLLLTSEALESTAVWNQQSTALYIKEIQT